MKDKSETSKLVMNFYVEVQPQFNINVKIIRRDNAKEFTSGPTKKFYKDNSIVHETSCVNTPQQNDRVERKNCHLLNVARALCFQANIPIEFFGGMCTYCSLSHK